MQIRDLEYVVALADELHFGRAAERCHVSQPALSSQLRKLEERLGVTLFERTRRHVQLTEVGAQIVVYAKAALRDLQLMTEVAEDARGPFKGTCTLGMPPTIGPYLTPLLLPALSHYLPDMRFDLVEDLTDDLEGQMLEGRVDLAILATAPAHKSLDEIKLYHEPFWVALPSHHALVERDAIDVGDIDARELLLLADGHCLRDQICDACRIRDRTGATSRGPKTQKTSLPTILSLVGAGLGVTLVPALSLAGAWMTDSGIAVRREESGTAGRTIRLTYRKGYHRMELVQKIADVIAGIVPDTVEPVRR